MAAVFIVLQTGIPDADLSLEAPPFAEGPLMSEADACAVAVSYTHLSLPAGTDPNGENGEYHTFCYDGPIFRTPVRFRLGSPFSRSYDIRLDDGTEKTYTYWFADLQEP